MANCTILLNSNSQFRAPYHLMKTELHLHPEPMPRRVNSGIVPRALSKPSGAILGVGGGKGGEGKGGGGGERRRARWRRMRRRGEENEGDEEEEEEEAEEEELTNHPRSLAVARWTR
eukprot:2650168-Pyramimonas_sp.AAC.1